MTLKPYYQDDYVTLYHADCLQHLDLLDQADVLITDPPYGSQKLADAYGRRGRTIANDLTTDARDHMLGAWGDKPVAMFGTPRLPEPPGEWADRLVWDKREPGLNGGPWRYTHESIFVRGNGWRRVSASSFSILSYPSGNGTWEKQQHVHAKPVRLMERLLEACPPEWTIIDPFTGSGSTLRAAKNLGRRAIGVEIEERYCEITAQRLAQEVLFV